MRDPEDEGHEFSSAEYNSIGEAAMIKCTSRVPAGRAKAEA